MTMSNEKTSKKSRVLAASLAVVLLASLLIGGATMSYLSASTDEDTVNTFAVNYVDVDLTESGDGEYNIVPGTSETKDPTVTVNTTVDTRVYVTITDTTDGLVEWEIADGWTLTYQSTATNGTTTYVYYRDIFVDDDADTTVYTYSVLKDDTVYYSNALTNEDMYDSNGNLKDNLQLNFSAFAIQLNGLSDSENPTFYYVPDNDSLTEALANADKGDVILLTGGSTRATAYTMDLSSADDTLTDVTVIGVGTTYVDTNCGSSILSSSSTDVYFYVENSTFDNIYFFSSQNIAMRYYGYASFSNCTFNDTAGLYSAMTTGGDVTFDSCKIYAYIYGINTTVQGVDCHVTIKNCDITGWNSFATSVTIENCAFHRSSLKYGILRFYRTSSVTNCTFDENFPGIDHAGNIKDVTITLTGCTWAGGDIKDILYENTLPDDISKAIYPATWIVDGEEVESVQEW